MASMIGKTFGNGVAGFPICATPITLVNHSLSSGATHGVLHHFWSTGAAITVDRLWVEYHIDGEATPSISFQPSHMCGLAASFLPIYMAYNHTDLYHAGAMCGRNSAVGGYFNTFPIPFGKSALVTVRADPQDCAKGCCGGGYLNVRGTENLPVVLPGSGIPLPATARLHLQKNAWAVRQPADHVPVVSVPAGNGLVFMSTLSVETQPVGGDRAGGGYIEGCWQFYSSADEPFPGLVVGTGVEDYFDSSYYFGADAGIFGSSHQIPSLMFRNELAGLTFFQREVVRPSHLLSASPVKGHSPLPVPLPSSHPPPCCLPACCSPVSPSPVSGREAMSGSLPIVRLLESHRSPNLIQLQSNKKALLTRASSAAQDSTQTTRSPSTVVGSCCGGWVNASHLEPSPQRRAGATSTYRIRNPLSGPTSAGPPNAATRCRMYLHSSRKRWCEVAHASMLRLGASSPLSTSRRMAGAPPPLEPPAPTHHHTRHAPRHAFRGSLIRIRSGVTVRT